MAEPARVRAAAVAALVFNAFVWGLAWWPFRALQQHGVHPLWSTALVYLASFGVFLAIRPGALAELARHPLLWLLAARLFHRSALQQVAGPA